MRLLIISHMPHHLRDGQVVGWGPTAREIDQLATRFESVRHVACLHHGDAPQSAIPYRAANVELVPVPPSGGPGLRGKLDVLRTMPRYVQTILSELPRADMVHVRAPAHIALISMGVLSLREQPKRRWFKYAGNWKPETREAISYHLQRWWLSLLPRGGFVSVNGRWRDQPEWIRTFYNPSLEQRDIQAGAQAAAGKQLTSPIRLLYVGRVEHEKGTGRALRVLEQLHARNIAATLDIIGDGEDRERFEQLARSTGVEAHTRFLGWLSPAQVNVAYTSAHILLLPTSASEGWPKVLSEGMAYGVVPVAGAVSSIPQYLSELETGAAIKPDDIDGFAAAITRYVNEPRLWQEHSRAALRATHLFTFTQYLQSIDSLIHDLEAL